VKNAVVSPTIGNEQTEFSLSFDVDRELDEDPIVDVDVGRPGRFVLVTAPPERAAGTWIFSYIPDGSERQDDASPVVTVKDELGRSSTTPVHPFTLDFRAPELSERSMSAPAIKRGGVVTATARLDDNATVTAFAELSDGTMLPLDTTVESLVVTAVLDVADEMAQGLATVFLSATDPAGNIADRIDVGEVAVDFTAPAVALLDFDAVVRPSSVVRLLATTNEAVVAPDLLIDGEPLQPDVRTGVAFTWTIVVPSADGPIDLQFDGAFVDAAGNESLLAQPSIFIDGSAPQVIGSVTLPDALRLGEILSLSRQLRRAVHCSECKSRGCFHGRERIGSWTVCVHVANVCSHGAASAGRV